MHKCAPRAPHIFAIGDIVGQPMLAHKAVHEAHVAAEVIAGELLGDAKLAKPLRLMPASFHPWPIPTPKSLGWA
jgi:pyruvate/2-oxoglutarate dehydrogenase complex dihydrolipoamide dehydrogenase (E3) component